MYNLWEYFYLKVLCSIYKMYNIVVLLLWYVEDILGKMGLKWYLLVK